MNAKRPPCIPTSHSYSALLNVDIGDYILVSYDLLPIKAVAKCMTTMSHMLLLFKCTMLAYLWSLSRIFCHIVLDVRWMVWRLIFKTCTSEESESCTAIAAI